MNHVFLQFFVISQVLISKGHPQEDNYESEDYLIPEAALANVCTLPENLGFSGKHFSILVAHKMLKISVDKNRKIYLYVHK